MSSESGIRWWLAIDGKSEGPFSTDEIGIRLRLGRITASTPACAEGLTEWKPIASWPALATAIPPTRVSLSQPPTPPVPPPFPNATPTAAPFGGGSEPVLTNPLLPQMANWICIYSIAAAPALWFFQHMLCCIDGTFSDDADLTFLFAILKGVDALKSLAVTFLLFVGATRFRRLRASGAMLIRIALWIGLIGGVVLFALGLMASVALAASADGGEVSPSSAENTAAMLVQAAQLVVGFCELLFMVFSLIWLTKHQRELPLTEGT